jgi:hypothetical protein
MAEVPDFGSSANFSTLIDDAGLMHEVIAHLSPVQEGVTAVIDLGKWFVANTVGQCNRWVGLHDAKTSSSERLFVNTCVQVGEAT